MRTIPRLYNHLLACLAAVVLPSCGHTDSDIATLLATTNARQMRPINVSSSVQPFVGRWEGQWHLVGTNGVSGVQEHGIVVEPAWHELVYLRAATGRPNPGWGTPTWGWHSWLVDGIASVIDGRLVYEGTGYSLVYTLQGDQMSAEWHQQRIAWTQHGVLFRVRD